MAQWKGSTQRGYRGRHRVRPGRVIPGHDLSTRWGRPTTLSKTHPAPREASASADTTDTGSGTVTLQKYLTNNRIDYKHLVHTHVYKVDYEYKVDYVDIFGALRTHYQVRPHI